VGVGGGSAGGVWITTMGGASVGCTGSRTVSEGELDAGSAAAQPAASRAGKIITASNGINLMCLNFMRVKLQ